MKRVGTILNAEERGVLILSAQLLTNEEIAERLGMSVIKVKTLIHQASVKLGAHTRHAAAFFAIMQGHVSIDEVFSPYEFAEYSGGLASDGLSKMAQVVRQGAGRGILQVIDKDILHIDKKQDTMLTRGERDVLILVGNGLTNKEIAGKLCVSVGTVRKILNRACSKLGASSRGEAFVVALKQRDIQISEVISLDKILRSLAQLKPEYLEKVSQLLGKKHEQKPLRIAG